MRKHSSRDKTETQFLTITGILVALIGGPAFFTLMKEPNVEVTKIFHQPTHKEKRLPANDLPADEQSAIFMASDGEPAVEDIKSDSRTSTFRIGCQETHEKQEVSSAHLRITGKSCGKPEQVQVLNHTNGFTASVFFTGENKFTTDYIDLKEGPNELEVISFFKDGKKLNQKLNISRRLPASVKN